MPIPIFLPTVQDINTLRDSKTFLGRPERKKSWHINFETVAHNRHCNGIRISSVIELISYSTEFQLKTPKSINNKDDTQNKYLCYVSKYLCKQVF